MKADREKIFIAGPYSEGDTARHVRRAINAADFLAQSGFAPYVPHLTHFWHFHKEHSHDFWLNLSCRFLLCCDGVLRLSGESRGADQEVELAEEFDIPVFYSLQELFEHYEDRTT